MSNVSAKHAAIRPSAQDIQDEIFRKMPVARKIKLMSGFFRFAHDLNPEGLRYGTRGIVEKNRRDTPAA